jgi:hypothetical protein
MVSSDSSVAEMSWRNEPFMKELAESRRVRSEAFRRIISVLKRPFERPPAYAFQTLHRTEEDGYQSVLRTCKTGRRDRRRKKKTRLTGSRNSQALPLSHNARALPSWKITFVFATLSLATPRRKQRKTARRIPKRVEKREWGSWRDEIEGRRGEVRVRDVRCTSVRRYLLE